MSKDDSRRQYWSTNLRIITWSLVIWALCSLVFGIILVEPLNAFSIGGYKLGFWFAQQGSIYVFIMLIFFYAWRMNRLDREYDVHEE
jgi:putative solute:sodium symporter small subunit